MTQEVESVAEVSVPVQEQTAAPDTVVETPEVVEVKSFSQEELDQAIGKRLAREQRKWEREQANRSAETQIVKAAPTNR